MSDDINYSDEDKRRVVIAEARATLARLDTKTAATTIKTKDAAMTIKPEPNEDYQVWLDRCVPNAMAGNPNLTRSSPY